jgi:flagellar protein FlgJ
MELKSIASELTTGVEQNLQERSLLKSSQEPDDKVRKSAQKVAREFEAMFAGFMVKSMRETVGKDSLTGGGHGEEVFRSMLDQEYAQAIAAQGTLGIAKNIENQLIENNRRTNPANRVNGVVPEMSRKGNRHD